MDYRVKEKDIRQKTKDKSKNHSHGFGVVEKIKIH
jgi:hypothetical protein